MSLNADVPVHTQFDDLPLECAESILFKLPFDSLFAIAGLSTTTYSVARSVFRRKCHTTVGASGFQRDIKIFTDDAPFNRRVDVLRFLRYFGDFVHTIEMTAISTHYGIMLATYLYDYCPTITALKFTNTTFGLRPPRRCISTRYGTLTLSSAVYEHCKNICASKIISYSSGRKHRCIHALKIINTSFGRRHLRRTSVLKIMKNNTIIRKQRKDPPKPKIFSKLLARVLRRGSHISLTLESCSLYGRSCTTLLDIPGDITFENCTIMNGFILRGASNHVTMRRCTILGPVQLVQSSAPAVITLMDCTPEDSIDPILARKPREVIYRKAPNQHLKHIIEPDLHE